MPRFSGFHKPVKSKRTRAAAILLAISGRRAALVAVMEPTGRWVLRAGTLALSAALLSCNNNPYGEFPANKVVFAAMADDPRTLDPTRVGDSTSNAIATNIHDTPFVFHYLKRPLTLIPSMATSLPVHGTTVVNGRVHKTFRFSIRRGLRYADDVCFSGGRGREIVIDDLIYAVKRSADNALDPFGITLLEKVLGFGEFSEVLEKARASKTLEQAMRGELPGVRKIDDYTMELVLTEEFPQIVYFFTIVAGSPIPAECVAYYSGTNGRPSYDRHPATSGPFYIKEWHPRYRIVLAKNPNYRKDDYFPSEGMPGDREAGFLAAAGRPLPLVDEFRFQIIQSGPPIWTLFEQGYLDRAGIPREVYNQVIQDQQLSARYVSMGIKLDREIDLASYWFNFNMDDPLFKNNKKLRQALSLVLDRKEMIERFMNNRGVPAQSPIPPGIEGYSEDYRNPYAEQNLELAKRLLAEAGYPNGIDPATGRALKVSLVQVASPGSTSLYRFYIDQFSKVNIELKIELLDWPTVIEKKNKKTYQMIHGSWGADYPDPQNFLQLLYGPNTANSYNENNYHNPAFDALYDQMKAMPPGPERRALIKRMIDIVSDDAPMMFLFHPIVFSLSHKWVAPIKPHPFDNNQLRFRDIDTDTRRALTSEWNRPPAAAYLLIFCVVGGLAVLAFIAVRQYNRGRS